MQNPVEFQMNTKAAADRRRLEAIRSIIEEDMAQVEHVILTGFDSEVSLVRTIGSHMLGLRGKLLRPMTEVLVARALGYEGREHSTLGAVLELVHAATLLHDDVVDQSSMRRGKISANEMWGNSASVLVGDFIVSRAIELAAGIGDPGIVDVIAYTTRRISEGEVMQLMNLRAAATGEEQYFDTIERKTAVLFETAARLGAAISGQNLEDQDQVAKFGNTLGIAFQLRDDILDYSGDAETIGKEVGDDLAEGKLTLPLIRALAVAAPEERRVIQSALESPEQLDIEAVCEIVVSCGAVEYTSGLARKYSRLAMQHAGHLPESVYRDALVELADFAVTRTF